MSVPAVVKKQVGIGKAYQNVFGQGDGRLVLVDLMKKSKLLEISPDDGPFENGRRSMIAEIMAVVRYDYGKLLALAEERVDENGSEE